MSHPISARKDGSNIMHTTGPDVCMTPIGKRVVPVAYTSMVTLAGSIRVSHSVRDNSNPDFQLNSRTRSVTGHEPGTKKGAKVAGYKGFAHARTAASTVFSEGFALVRDADPAWINHPDPQPQEGRRSKSSSSVGHF
ncbi:PAAR-like domain-containing protein [Tateyamaria sp. syn59]|uniref:PAAR-like domain-containing protein n=1 Tax=Tateyamaria sp. syn59 TaxID=2576942 RepID=UPI0011BD76D5|nr:PAAR-like domain-containing protein [Tateyamaria sp. syn59]